MADFDAATLRTMYPGMSTQAAPRATTPGNPSAFNENDLSKMYGTNGGKTMYAQRKPEAPSNPSAFSEKDLGEMYPTKGASQDAASNDAGSPHSLELKLPEGFNGDDPVVGEFRKAAGELGLDSAKAQRLFDMHQRVLSDQRAAADAEIDGWAASTKADSEIGGHRFNESIGLGSGLINEFGTPQLREALVSTGMGSHPELIRLLSRAASALRESRRKR